MFFVTGLLAGCVVGAVASAWVLVVALRRKMVEASASFFSFDETERRLRDQVAATPGWGLPAPELDFAAALAKKGFAAQGVRRAKIFFLCNPSYAATAVGAEHRMIGMMPCHWALYETEDGRVLLSRLNIPLMSRMFSGAVGRVLSQVGRDERRMMPGLLGGPAAGAPGTAPSGP